MSGFTLRYWTSIQNSTKYFRTAWTSMSGFTVKSGSSRRSVGRTMSEITVKRHVWRQSAQVRQTWQVGVIFKYVRFHGILVGVIPRPAEQVCPVSRECICGTSTCAMGLS